MSEKTYAIKQVISLLVPYIDKDDDQECPYMVLLGSRAASFHKGELKKEKEKENATDWDFTAIPSAAISFLEQLDEKTEIHVHLDLEKRRKDLMIISGHDMKHNLLFDLCIVTSKSGAIVQDYDIVRFIHQDKDRKMSSVFDLKIDFLVTPLEICEVIKTSHVHLSEDFCKHVERLHDIRDELFKGHNNKDNIQDNSPLIKRSDTCVSILKNRQHQKYLHLHQETQKDEFKKFKKDDDFSELTNFQDKVKFVIFQDQVQDLKSLATGFPITPLKEFIVNNYRYLQYIISNGAEKSGV